jgi:hypothetical protein
MALLAVGAPWQRLARRLQMSQRTDSDERPSAQMIQRSGQSLAHSGASVILDLGHGTTFH